MREADLTELDDEGREMRRILSRDEKSELEQLRREKQERAGAAQSQEDPWDDVFAGFLAFFIGPVGLWYKQKWAAGFAWLAMTLLLALTGIGCFVVPFCWLGMIVHAAAAERD